MLFFFVIVCVTHLTTCIPACIRAMESVPVDTPLEIHTDSEYVRLGNIYVWSASWCVLIDLLDD